MRGSAGAARRHCSRSPRGTAHKNGWKRRPCRFPRGRRRTTAPLWRPQCRAESPRGTRAGPCPSNSKGSKSLEGKARTAKRQRNPHIPWWCPQGKQTGRRTALLRSHKGHARRECTSRGSLPCHTAPTYPRGMEFGAREGQCKTQRRGHSICQILGRTWYPRDKLSSRLHCTRTRMARIGQRGIRLGRVK